MSAASVALVLVALAGASSGQDPAQRARVGTLRVRVLSTMLADRGVGEWGFAALVEVDGRALLFDTGARPHTVLDNARELGVDLARVTDVVLSHHHADHTGGLLALRQSLVATSPDALARVHVGAGIFAPRRSGELDGEANPMVALRAEFEATGGVFVEHAQPHELFPGVWLSGGVPRVRVERNWSGAARVERGGAWVEDDVPEDLSLFSLAPRGIVVVAGCGHAGIVNICLRARELCGAEPILAAVGGFHLFAADDQQLAATARELRALGLTSLLGAHCTGLEAVYRLRQLVGLERADAVVAAVGSSFTLGAGIDPLALAR